jgi:hypothetical protein
MVGSGDALERIRFRQTAEDRFSFDRYFLPLTTPKKATFKDLSNSFVVK